jgi:hemolysin activation/secretion protein
MRRAASRFARVRAAIARALALASLACATLASAQVAAPAPTFEVRRYAIEGNSLLPAERLDAVLAPYTGAARSFNDVQAAAAALEQAYAQAGFGAVKVVVPEQRMVDGLVRLQVTEARLRHVTVTGNAAFDAVNIRRSVPSLRQDAAPNTAELGREIRLANENPAKRVSVELFSDAPGIVDAAVTVADEKPWKVGAVLDNTGTPETGRLRSGVFFQQANVADLDHVFTGQYVTSPDHLGEVTILAANYRIPVVGLGDSVDLFGVHADVDSGVVGDLFNLRGRGSVAGIRYNRHLEPAAGYRHRLSFGLEYRVIDNRVSSVAGGADLVPDVTVHPASLGYAGAWLGANHQLDFSTTYVQNIPGGPHGHASDLTAVRSGARASYSMLRASFAYVGTLPEDWQLRIAGDGQYTQDALVSGEQFGIGGQDSVRGFFEREITNDRGYRASVELLTADFGNRMIPGLSARGLVFVDRGGVARNRALAGETTEASIASVGAGVRLALAPRATLRIDVAHVLRGAGSRSRGSESVHFSAGIAF